MSCTKEASLPLFARLIFASRAYNRGVEENERIDRQRMEAEAFNVRMQELERFRMAPIIGSLRHTRVPIILSPGSPEPFYGGNVPLGMDEGMVRMASAMQKVGIAMAVRDMELLKEAKGSPAYTNWAARTAPKVPASAVNIAAKAPTSATARATSTRMPSVGLPAVKNPVQQLPVASGRGSFIMGGSPATPGVLPPTPSITSSPSNPSTVAPSAQARRRDVQVMPAASGEAAGRGAASPSASVNVSPAPPPPQTPPPPPTAGRAAHAPAAPAATNAPSPERHAPPPRAEVQRDLTIPMTPYAATAVEPTTPRAPPIVPPPRPTVSKPLSQEAHLENAIRSLPPTQDEAVQALTRAAPKSRMERMKEWLSPTKGSGPSVAPVVPKPSVGAPEEGMSLSTKALLAAGALGLGGAYLGGKGLEAAGRVLSPHEPSPELYGHSFGTAPMSVNQYGQPAYY